MQEITLGCSNTQTGHQYKHTFPDAITLELTGPHLIAFRIKPASTFAGRNFSDENNLRFGQKLLTFECLDRSVSV